MVLKSGDMERSLKELTYHLEEPRVGQSYPNFFAAKLASKFVKVVLSGVGGDELFGGYSSPDSSWFKGESIDFVKKTIFNKKSKIYEILDKKVIETLVNEHLDRKK